MPVPKRKRSRARRDSRFANKGIKVLTSASCGNCSAALQPHSACKACGFYGGAKVVSTKIDRSIRRAQLRQAQAQRAKQEQAA